MYAIHIPVEELNKNQKFAELLTDLGRKVNKHGVRLNLEKRLEQTRNSLTQAKYSWLTNNILHHEVSELLADLEVKDQNGSLALDEKQLKEVLTIALAFSEMEKYLHYQPDPNSRSTLFNLSPRQIANHNPVAKHTSAIQQTTLPLLEDRLRQKCENLYNFYKNDQDKDGTSEELMVSKYQSLPAVIEQKLQKLEQKKKTLELNQLNGLKQFWLYYQKLLEGISLMKQMLKDHKMARQSEIDQINISWLKALCDVYCQKLQLTQLQILCKTYSKDFEKALTKISKYLDEALQQSQHELASTQHTLQGYHAIGDEFESLVSEFTKLQTEIDTRKWGLSRLGNWAGSGSEGEQAAAKTSGKKVSFEDA